MHGRYRRSLEIRPIRTEADYRLALQEIETLMEAQPGTPEEDRLDVLATLVKAYEDVHHPSAQSDWETIEPAKP